MHRDFSWTFPVTDPREYPVTTAPKTDDGYLQWYDAGFRLGILEANRYRLTLQPVALFLAGALTGVTAVAASAWMLGIFRG